MYPSLEDGEKPKQEQEEQPRTRIGFEGLEEEQAKTASGQQEEIELLAPGERKRPKAS